MRGDIRKLVAAIAVWKVESDGAQDFTEVYPQWNQRVLAYRSAGQVSLFRAKEEKFDKLAD